MIPTPISQDWQASGNGDGTILEGVADVEQCITNILLTQRGSDPFRKDFGVDILALIDKPVNEVAAQRPFIQRQIETYEPRCKVVALTVAVNVEIVTFVLTWIYRPTGQTVESTIPYVAA